MTVKRFMTAIFGILVLLFSGCGTENPGESKVLENTEIVCAVTEENLPEESESVSEEMDTGEIDTQDVFAEGYTDDELEEMVRYYYEMQREGEGLYPYIKVDSKKDGQVTFLLYKELDEHVVTFGNYTVDRRTGKGKDEISGEDIDLEETLFFINLEKEHEGEEVLHIPCIYADQEYFIFSAGEIRGRERRYYGDFYVYNRKDKVYEACAHLTDGDTFRVIGNYIYYNKFYDHDIENDEKGSGLFRVDLSLEHEEQIGEAYSFVEYDREHDLIFAEKKPGKYNYQSSLVIISKDGAEEKILFDPKGLDWDFQTDAYDKIHYTNIVCDGRTVFATVEHWGYRDGQWGWWDNLLNKTEIEVEL